MEKPYWNYRVIRRKSSDPDAEWEYGIYECWYDRGQGPDEVPDNWTAEPLEELTDSSVDALRAILERMLKGTRHPVLCEDGDRLVEVKSD